MNLKGFCICFQRERFNLRHMGLIYKDWTWKRRASFSWRQLSSRYNLPAHEAVRAPHWGTRLPFYLDLDGGRDHLWTSDAIIEKFSKNDLSFLNLFFFETNTQEVSWQRWDVDIFFSTLALLKPSLYIPLASVSELPVSFKLVRHDHGRQPGKRSL